MNTALLAHSFVWMPLQGLIRWLNHRPSIKNSPDTFTYQFPVGVPSKRVAPSCRSAAKQHALEVSIKPLRVVRVLEAGQGRNTVGRMLISGRMADVCAELDRLAACEAALS